MQGGTRQVGMREESLLAEMFFVCVGVVYFTSGAGRRRPSPWLSRHKARRPVGLAAAVRRFGAKLESIVRAERGKRDRAPELMRGKPSGRMPAPGT